MLTSSDFRTALQHPIFRIVSDTAAEMGVSAYLIGGYVRDILLERDLSENDIDIVVTGSGIDLASKVAEKLGSNVDVKVFKNFGTAMISFGDWQIEFVGARKESYRLDSRKPLVEEGTIEEDQKRRDFTINAMSISLMRDDFGKLVDPFNGLKDLRAGIIRTPLDPDLTFSDDPLRMMRAIRFASQLGFRIVAGTFEGIARNSGRIGIVSVERITDELNKILSSPAPSVGLGLLEASGLLKLILPQVESLKGVEYVEGKGHKDNFLHTLEVTDKVALQTSNLWLRWAALLHDIGKPATKKFEPGVGWTFHGHDFKGSKMVPAIFQHLRLPQSEKMKYVQKLVLLHLRPIVLSQETVTDSAVRRLLIDAGEDIDDLMLLCEADITSKNPQKVRRYLENFNLVRQKLKEIEEKDQLRNWQPPVSGDLIMDTFGLKPCREVGIIKTAIREAILEGIIGNNFEEARRLMLAEGAKIGLKPLKN